MASDYIKCPVKTSQDRFSLTRFLKKNTLPPKTLSDGINFTDSENKLRNFVFLCLDFSIDFSIYFSNDFSIDFLQFWQSLLFSSTSPHLRPPFAHNHSRIERQTILSRTGNTQQCDMSEKRK